MTTPAPLSATALREQITLGQPNPALSPEIARCKASPLVRAGLHLHNGDWDAAHRLSQENPSSQGNHWHALVHRHEPDYANSKYWFHRVQENPVFADLAQEALRLGVAETVAPGGNWDPFAFTDAYARPNRPDWALRLDRLEMTLLLDYLMRTEKS